MFFSGVLRDIASLSYVDLLNAFVSICFVLLNGIVRLIVVETASISVHCRTEIGRFSLSIPSTKYFPSIMCGAKRAGTLILARTASSIVSF